MRTEPPTLLPLLRSQVQGNLLALTYLNPDTEFTLTEAAQRVGASVKAVHHEVNRLVDAGLLVDRKHGNNRLVRAVTDSLLSRPLTDLLAVTYGPLSVVTDAVRGIPGVEEAFIYGSWAARYDGEPGQVPRDVDVLIVGDADPDELDEAARRAEQRLGGREVSMRRIRPAAWRDRASNDPFLASVRARPLVRLHVTDDEETGH
jgi:predicted nucleotidyltransferase